MRIDCLLAEGQFAKGSISICGPQHTRLEDLVVRTNRAQETTSARAAKRPCKGKKIIARAVQPLLSFRVGAVNNNCSTASHDHVSKSKTP